MKRFLSLALLLGFAAAVGLAGTASARAFNLEMRVPNKMAGTDSAYVSLPNGTIPFGGVGGTNADPDTTGWFNVGGYNLQNCGFDSQTQVIAYLRAKSTAPTVVVGDSLALQVQYALDFEKTVIYTSAVQFKPMTVGGTTSFDAMHCDTDNSDPALGAVWMRFIIGDGDLSRTAPWEDVYVRVGLSLQNSGQ